MIEEQMLDSDTLKCDFCLPSHMKEEKYLVKIAQSSSWSLHAENFVILWETIYSVLNIFISIFFNSEGLSRLVPLWSSVIAHTHF